MATDPSPNPVMSMPCVPVAGRPGRVVRSWFDPRVAELRKGSEKVVHCAGLGDIDTGPLGDLVKLHLSLGAERMLAKVPGERYPTFRGREGERLRITWKEEDVQLLRA